MWWSLLVCAALATPIPIALPAGEDPAAWAEPLALAELTPGHAATGPRVEVSIATEGWTLVVRDPAGALHVLAVDGPTNRAEREALAHLAASLARPVTVWSLPMAPPPSASAPSAPTPRSAPGPLPTGPAPDPAPADAPPEVAEPPRATEVADRAGSSSAPVPEGAPVAADPVDEALANASIEVRAPSHHAPWASEGWARGSAGLAWRDRGGAVSATGLLGWGAGPARVGAGFGLSGPHAVAGTELSWTALDGLAGAWFAIPDGPVLGLLGGVSWRRYGSVLAVGRGVAGAELGWRAALAPRVDVVPVLRVDLDPGLGGLRRTTVTVDGVRVIELSPVALKLEIGVAPHGVAR